MTPIARLAAAPLFVLALFAASEANAQCGMGDIDWYATEEAQVAHAEGLLEQGEPQEAAWLLQRMWPQLHDAVPVASSVPAIAEGVRVMALAAVRSDGDIRSGLGWSSRTARERVANVAWGLSRLRMLAVANPSNDDVKTSLGEALSRAPATRAEAATILEALDASHGIASAEGYAALALVRTEANDPEGAQVASEECERRASNVAVQCASLGGRVTPGVTASR